MSEPGDGALVAPCTKTIRVGRSGLKPSVSVGASVPTGSALSGMFSRLRRDFSARAIIVGRPSSLICAIKFLARSPTVITEKPTTPVAAPAKTTVKKNKLIETARTNRSKGLRTSERVNSLASSRW